MGNPQKKPKQQEAREAYAALIAKAQIEKARAMLTARQENSNEH